MKKFLFAGIGFLCCGVAVFNISQALTIEVTPCSGTNSTARCSAYSYSTNGYACSNLNNCYVQYNYRPNTTNVTAQTRTTVYRGSYVRNYQKNYNRPITNYQTYTNSYLRPVNYTNTNYTNCGQPSCFSYNQSVARPVTTYTQPTYNYNYDYNYNQTFYGRIKSSYERNYNTYLITPDVVTNGMAWDWNYNSYGVNCEIVANNALRCAKVSNIPSEITVDFYLNGKTYKSNVINL